MQEQIACDLCGRTNAATYLTLPDQSAFGLVQCQYCGLVYLDPRPSPDEIGQHYTSDYYTSLPPRRNRNLSPGDQVRQLAYQARCQDLSSETHPSRRALLNLAKLALGWRVRRRVPVRSKGRLLDVGCGNGQWIAWIHQTIPGWEVEGIEVNLYAATQAQSIGPTVYVGQLESLNLPAAQYDMISFWHSLEHIYSPTTALQEAYRLLRPGGWLGIEVPDINSWEARLVGGAWYHLAVPVHLYHFSMSSLQQMLSQCGFRIIAQEHVRGHTSLAYAAKTGDLGQLGLPRSVAYFACVTLGRMSPWGIRVYAVKP